MPIQLPRPADIARACAALLLTATAGYAQAALVPPAGPPSNFFINAGAYTSSEGAVGVSPAPGFSASFSRDNGRTLSVVNTLLGPNGFTVLAEALADGSTQANDASGYGARASLQVYTAFQVDAPGVYLFSWNQGVETSGPGVLGASNRVQLDLPSGQPVNHLGAGAGSFQFAAQPGQWYSFSLQQQAFAAGGRNFGIVHTYASVTLSPVPEPASAALMGLGLLVALAAVARRRAELR